MKTFDESAVAVNVLEAPVTWALAMQETTGAALEDLEDYARRRALWANIVRSEQSGRPSAPPCVTQVLKYLLGMEHLQ